MAHLIVRIELDSEAHIGSDAIRLLELIATEGSISAAGRAHGITYGHAWRVLDEFNRMFKAPVIAAHCGGAHGGGARLTAFGREVIDRYRAIESSAARLAANELAALEAAADSGPPKAG